jgi:hypothetical protein
MTMVEALLNRISMVYSQEITHNSPSVKSLFNELQKVMPKERYDSIAEVFPNIHNRGLNI